MDYEASQKNFHSAITPEQLNQIIEAITDGRYSWACVLTLRFIGYNPLHFIPQRTYSRLIKENSSIMTAQVSTKPKVPTNVKSSVNSSSHKSSANVFHKINELDYLENSEKKATVHQISGQLSIIDRSLV